MANYFYPQGYIPPQSQAQMQMPIQAQTQMQMPAQQIQNGGFVSVRNETEARNYPVAPGNSITFKDEMAPYVYTKTMGFSQLDRPIFEKFKLVKEDAVEPQNLTQNESINLDPINSSINNLNEQIKAIWEEIDGLKKKASIKSAPKKKEVEDDPE